MGGFILLVVLLILLVVWLGRSKPITTIRVVDGVLLLPVDQYYGWMLLDADLAINPLLDVALPLPTFRTLGSGAIQVVGQYSYDKGRPIDPRYAAGRHSGAIIANSFAASQLAQALSSMNKDGKAITVSDLQLTQVGSGTIQAAATLDGIMVHDFYFMLKALPATPVRGRRAHPSVGYFSNRVTYETRDIDIIQSYRRQVIRWAVTADVPTRYRSIAKEAVAYWNERLKPYRATLTLDDEPWTGHVADPEINLICMAKAISGYTGVGTTAVDLRSGEHLWSRIAFDPLSANDRLSLFSRNDRELTTNIEALTAYVFKHELGHTMGLRHNFIAAADGYSSVMAYLPQWYPDDGGQLHFMRTNLSGGYDTLAIEYGYRPCEGETLAHVPPLLIERIKATRYLFHTDENIDGDRILSHVHRKAISDGLNDPRLWLKAWAAYRPRIFKDPQHHLRDVKRTFFFLDSITSACTNAVKYVHGYQTDYQRQRLIPNDCGQQVLADIAEYFVGDAWRLGTIENDLTAVALTENGTVVNERPYNGQYSIDRAPVEDLHMNAVLAVSQALFAPERVAVMPDAGGTLLALMTTPSSLTKRTIVGGSDQYHLNTVTAVLATVEHFKDEYSGSAQVKLTEATDLLVSSLKDRHRKHVTQDPKRYKKRLLALRKAKPPCQCGNFI